MHCLIMHDVCRLQQLCLMDIDACKKHARNICFILFHSSDQVLWLLLQQSTFACLRHVADDETGLSCAASRCRIPSFRTFTMK